MIRPPLIPLGMGHEANCNTDSAVTSREISSQNVETVPAHCSMRRWIRCHLAGTSPSTNLVPSVTMPLRTAAHFRVCRCFSTSDTTLRFASFVMQLRTASTMLTLLHRSLHLAATTSAKLEPAWLNGLPQVLNGSVMEFSYDAVLMNTTTCC